MSERKIILGIESSCDDTAAAVSINNKICSNIAATQEIHREYGGVVPELASRAHQTHIVPVVHQALERSGYTLSDLDGIAYTHGPGLMGSLLVGTSFAKAMAQSLDIPLIQVHHMKAHVLAHLIDDGSPIPPFPFLCLTVSGGHTQIIQVNAPLEMTILGQTIDDAAGEAFDKAAKMMGLPYPGGPLIDQLAKDGEPAYAFPIPKIEGLDYSFSGLKTSFLYFLQKEMRNDERFIEIHKHDLAASIQQVLIDFLLQKLRRAIRETGIKHIAVAGGVSANSFLRKRVKQLEEKEGCTTYIPAFEYCTDNAAMICTAGYYLLLEGDLGDVSKPPLARWSFTES